MFDRRGGSRLVALLQEGSAFASSGSCRLFRARPAQCWVGCRVFRVWHSQASPLARGPTPHANRARDLLIFGPAASGDDSETHLTKYKSTPASMPPGDKAPSQNPRLDDPCRDEAPSHQFSSRRCAGPELMRGVWPDGRHGHHAAHGAPPPIDRRRASCRKLP